MKWTPRTLWSSGYSPALSYSCLLGYLMTGACSASSKSSPDAGGGAPLTGLQKLNHVVVVVLENWSYDSLYGEFFGAEGLANAKNAPPQIDGTGAPYLTLPQTETHLPQTLANAPFPLDSYIPISADTSTDLTNNFYEEQRQIHGGAMDQFILYNTAAKGLTMGYYHTTINLSSISMATVKVAPAAPTSKTRWISWPRHRTEAFQPCLL